MTRYHEPVLLQEILNNFSDISGRYFIDATVGGGGHSIELAKKGGIVLGIDTDSDAINYTKKRWEEESAKHQIEYNHLQLIKGNFRNLLTIAQSKDFTSVDGILFDIGVSSYQIDTPERGFSFQTDALLDMRMDKELGVTAADLINALSKKELTELFRRWGEESRAAVIASRIVEKRKISLITKTKELAEIVKQIYSGREEIHPATKIFQALRIAVNDELRVITEALPQAVHLLNPHGVLQVISFHSLEDRIVKNTFKSFEEKKVGTVRTKKPITPTNLEIEKNRRSRSAKLRVFEKGNTI